MRFYQKGNTIVPHILAGDMLKHIESIKLSEASLSSLPMNPAFSYSHHLQSYLQGKRLLLDEIPFSLEMVQQHYENGYILYERGVYPTKDGFCCNRCGNRRAHLFFTYRCARCGNSCTYCRSCIMMGRISECTPLIRWTGPDVRYLPQDSPLVWSGTLSEGQRAASEEVIKAIDEKTSCLIWAVCGAGKTEVLFEGIALAVSKGERICIATPRIDVVLELVPRIKEVFPSIEIAGLYGGSEQRESNAQFVISTTHQLFRYYHAFDTVVIDEVDAFPYSVDTSLQYAAAQARKECSSLIYLTATPSAEWKEEVKRGKRRAVKVSARYHRHPLPVPFFLWCGNWKRGLARNRLPVVVLKWIKRHMVENKPLLLFMPHVQQVEETVRLLKKEDPRIEGVHAEDPLRKEKVAGFRKGDIPLLVTTTILERGVTVPNLQAAVLGAEDEIFTESALVQIAGRAGRSSRYPSGEVVFFYCGKTRAMNAARRHIIEMNKEAKRKGWIV
jgi:competence protein ComFA